MVYRLLRRGAWGERAGPDTGRVPGDLKEVIALVLEHRREDSLRSMPADAKQELVVVG